MSEFTHKDRLSFSRTRTDGSPDLRGRSGRFLLHGGLQALLLQLGKRKADQPRSDSKAEARGLSKRAGQASLTSDGTCDTPAPWNRESCSVKASCVPSEAEHSQEVGTLFIVGAMPRTQP